jgi:hypothetical protein
MTLLCSSCEQEVEDETDWHDDDQMCNACWEVGDAAQYCCGVIYEDGEDTCMSCGDPL